MKKINLYKIFAILFIAISTACVDNNDFDLPTIVEQDKEYTNLMSLSEITALYNGSVVDFNDYIAQNNLEDINTYGYVISDDNEGNFYKTLTIQDKLENPTVGLKIQIDATNINAIYNVGRKVYIKLKGLGLNKSFEEFEIGAVNGNDVDRIEESEYRKHIERSFELATIIPTELTIGELRDNHINTLVKINNIQSETKGLTYADPNTTFSQNRYFNTCDTFETIIMRTSGFSTFKSYSIPDNKGSITAILGKYRSDYQLYIRDTNDVDLTEEYGCFNNPTAASLASVKDLFTPGGNEVVIADNLKIKVVVTSDLASNNISNRNAFAQEGTTGIALRFSEAYDLNLGDEIEISVGGTKLSEYNGLLQLNLSTSNIISKTAGTLPSPEVITMAQALSGDYESRLVTIEGLQFKDITKMYSGSLSLTSDCNDELKSYFRSDATFSANQVSDKKGALTGIMTDFNGAQIYLRNEADVNFTEDYTTCGGGGGGTTGGADLYISEYVEGSSNNKYIEIYNGTGAAVDLSKYQVWGSSNGGGWKAARQLQLTGTLADGGFFIISTDAAVDAIQNVADMKLPYESPVHYNGDDAVALAKDDGSGNYVEIDVIGTPDSDPGSAWDVAGVANATKDRTLIRKSSVTQGNTDWAASAGTDAASSEWEVKDKDDFSSIGVR
ncbi:MAG: DUF5689 domain-containing protein [Tenacibaculum sp.]